MIIHSLISQGRRQLVHIASFVALVASTQVMANDTTFGDWKMACQPNCVLTQGLADTANPNIKFAVQMAKVVETKALIVQLNFPLGIYLQQPIGITIDDYHTKVPMTVCLPSGCNAVFELPKAMRQALMKGSMLHVTFYASETKPNKISFLLNGIVAGITALEAAPANK